jgi:transcriptional regulator with XRE-family HTH domain
MSIGTNLKKSRKMNGFSQELIAEKIGVSRQAVSKWENDISSPSTNSLMKISNLFGVDIDVLTNGEVVSGKNEKGIFKRNEFYILGAVFSLLAFIAGMTFGEVLPILMVVGIAGMMGMMYCISKL